MLTTKEHSICGHIIRRPDEYPRKLQSGEIVNQYGHHLFVIRIRQHYQLNHKCAMLAAQDPVVRYIAAWEKQHGKPKQSAKSIKKKHRR
tara:strand:+ start:819 stop:1085 length:267 start_codon:yes stop_codon:yes gene_type:complete